MLAEARGGPIIAERRTILFVRQLETFSGGHLKVFDYLGHAASASWLAPRLYLAPSSDEALARSLTPTGVERIARPTKADLYFVAGMDWALLDEGGLDLSEAPVVNLIQHVWHAHEGNPRRQYLARPALRICVSPEVASAITPLANGPVLTIPNGVDVAGLGTDGAPRHRRVFIGGLKNPGEAQACAAALATAGAEVDLCLQPVDRYAYLARIAACQVSVLLPSPLEGFYLPGLEAMALGSVPVVPDCLGARSFCLDGHNCLVPAYRSGDICTAALRLLGDNEVRERMRVNGAATAARHSLARERERALEAFGNALEEAPSR